MHATTSVRMADQPAAKRPRTDSCAKSDDQLWAPLRHHAGGLGPAAALRGNLRAASPTVRETAAIALGLTAAASPAHDWRPTVQHVCAALAEDSEGAVRQAAALALAALGPPPTNGAEPAGSEAATLARAAQALAAAAADPDGDVRAAAAKALSSVLSSAAAAAPLLADAVATLTALVPGGSERPEPLAPVRQAVLKSLGKLGGQLRARAPGERALRPAFGAVVAQLAVEPSADWRADAPGVLAALYCAGNGDAGPDGAAEDQLVGLLGHAHEGVGRTAAASLVAITQAGGDAALFGALSRPLGNGSDVRLMLAALAVVSEAFGSTQWSFEGGGLWVQGKEAAAAADPGAAKSKSNATALAGLWEHCTTCLRYGDGESGLEEEEEESEEAAMAAAVRSAATHAVAALGKRMPSEERLAALRGVLGSEKALHRASGLEAVGRLGPAAAATLTEDVLEALKDTDGNVRWTAAVAAGQVLRVAAEGDSAEAAAVAALGEEERTSAAAVLQGVMEDEDEEVPVRMVSQPQPADRLLL